MGHAMSSTNPGLSADFLDRDGYWDEHPDGYGYVVHLAPISPSAVIREYPGARHLFASSGAVYSGVGEYALNKIAWESLYSSVAHVIARPFAFVGPWLKRHAVYEFIQQARQGRITINGTGSAVRTYLYADDLGRWLWKILLDGTGIYDVGGCVQYTILDVAGIVASFFPGTEILVRNDPEVPCSLYVPDLTRAYELGCRETVSLHEAIERTICLI